MYRAVIRNDKLGKHKVLVGEDVEAIREKANILLHNWDKQWIKKEAKRSKMKSNGNQSFFSYLLTILSLKN